MRYGGRVRVHDILGIWAIRVWRCKRLIPFGIGWHWIHDNIRAVTFLASVFESLRDEAFESTRQLPHKASGTSVPQSFSLIRAATKTIRLHAKHGLRHYFRTGKVAILKETIRKERDSILEKLNC